MKGAIAESDRRFEIPGIAQVVEGNGGLPKVRITSPEVIGEMYLYGAHVTSWKPDKPSSPLRRIRDGSAPYWATQPG